MEAGRTEGMMMARRPDVGAMFLRDWSPETLIPFARRAEAIGLDELWVIEDTLYSAGIAQAATALAVTHRLRVGLGIAPAVAHNAAILAMEFATLARMHPGRFLPGIGHGVAAWMTQIGARPPSWLAALEETTTAVRSLLAGETVTMDGRTVRLSDVRLDQAPAVVPPVSVGVMGNRSLELAGRVADGTVLSEYSSPAYVAAARRHIAAGMAEAGRTAPHRLTVYMHGAVDQDGPGTARDALRPVIAGGLAGGGFTAHMAALPFADELSELIAQGGEDAVQREMPDAWLDDLAAAGTPEQAAATIERLVAAGADSVVFVAPPSADPATWLEAIGRDLLPMLNPA